MPFQNSYIDPDKPNPPKDAREAFAALAPKVVRQPVSSHLLKMRTRMGKERYVVVDFAQRPDDGELGLMEYDAGFRVVRMSARIAIRKVIGKITWFLEQA